MPGPSRLRLQPADALALPGFEAEEGELLLRGPQHALQLLGAEVEAHRRLAEELAGREGGVRPPAVPQRDRPVLVAAAEVGRPARRRRFDQLQRHAHAELLPAVFEGDALPGRVRPQVPEPHDGGVGGGAGQEARRPQHRHPAVVVRAARHREGRLLAQRRALRPPRPGLHHPVPTLREHRAGDPLQARHPGVPGVHGPRRQQQALQPRVPHAQRPGVVAHRQRPGAAAPRRPRQGPRLPGRAPQHPARPGVRPGAAHPPPVPASTAAGASRHPEAGPNQGGGAAGPGLAGGVAPSRCRHAAVCELGRPRGASCGGALAKLAAACSRFPLFFKF